MDFLTSNSVVLYGVFVLSHWEQTQKQNSLSLPVKDLKNRTDQSNAHQPFENNQDNAKLHPNITGRDPKILIMILLAHSWHIILSIQ